MTAPAADRTEYDKLTTLVNSRLTGVAGAPCTPPSTGSTTLSGPSARRPPPCEPASTRPEPAWTPARSGAPAAASSRTPQPTGRASTTRDIYRATAAALLPEPELHRLTAATSASGK